MAKQGIAGGVVHKVPADLERALTSAPAAQAAWEDITPLVRNEWICWVEDAKKSVGLPGSGGLGKVATIQAWKTGLTYPR